MSSAAQHENTRRLSEFFAETVPGLHVLAIRDLADGSGETLLVEQVTSVNSLDDDNQLVVTTERKEYELTATFDELNAAGNEAGRSTLFARWTHDMATEKPVVDDTPKPTFGKRKAGK